MLRRLLLMSFILIVSGTVLGQTTDLATEFSYQGYLEQGGIAITDTCAMNFALFDALSGGSAITGTTTQSEPAVSVTNGVFNVTLDFGIAAFDGGDHYLDIAVQCTGDPSATPLSPRQPLTPAPYAIALYGLRTEPNATSPNVLGGYNGNLIEAGVVGSAIGGGGEAGSLNIIYDNFGFIGGGRSNVAGSVGSNVANSPWAAVAGGLSNEATATTSFVGGGGNNQANATSSVVVGGANNTNEGAESVIGGGNFNVMLGENSVIAGGGGGTDPQDFSRVSTDGNLAYDDYNVIGGGSGNITGDDFFTRDWAVVGGGVLNTASGSYSTVSGGEDNTASNINSTVGGGANNTASGGSTTVGGGVGNTASGTTSTIGGGLGNSAIGTTSTIGGGDGNTASTRSTVGGGDTNAANGFTSTVGGGAANTASGSDSTVSGGDTNTASGSDSTVGGGEDNTAQGFGSTVGGGNFNVVIGARGTIAGGGGGSDPTDATETSFDGNLVYDDFGTIGGGSNNITGNSDTSTTTGRWATVSGGSSNTASGFASAVGGGSGNEVSGSYSFAAGGNINFASGNYSFVAGRSARTVGNNSFLWNDGSFMGSVGSSNRFIAVSSGGVAFYTAASGSSLGSAGVQLAGGGSGWIGVSDRNMKENFEPVDSAAVLEALATMPLTEWNYITQDDAIRHMGVMAQDFNAAFGLGEDPLGINTIDMDGVTVAAIQGLYQQNLDQQTIIEDQQDEMEALAARLTALEAQLGNDSAGGGNAYLNLLGLLALVAGVYAFARRQS